MSRTLRRKDARRQGTWRKRNAIAAPRVVLLADEYAGAVLALAPAHCTLCGRHGANPSTSLHAECAAALAEDWS